MPTDYENIKNVSYAAIVDRCIAHPLENLITSHQNTGGKISPIIKQMQQAGIKHIYSGFFGSLISTIPIRIGTYSTFFISYDYFKESQLPQLKSSIYASTLSALTESCILFPSDINRTRKLLSSQKKLSSSIIWKSYSMLLTRLIIENNIGLAGADILIHHINPSKDNKVLIFVLALLAGMGSQALPAPFDWIKTKHMDGKATNFKKEFTHMVSHGIFRNILLRSARAGICNAIVFSIANNNS